MSLDQKKEKLLVSLGFITASLMTKLSDNLLIIDTIDVKAKVMAQNTV